MGTERGALIDAHASNAMTEQIAKEDRLMHAALLAGDETDVNDLETKGNNQADDRRTHAEKMMGYSMPRAQTGEDLGQTQPRVVVDTERPVGEDVNGLSEEEYLRRLNLQTSKNIWRACNANYSVNKPPEQSTNRDTYRWDDDEVEFVDKTHHRRKDALQQYMERRARDAKLSRAASSPSAK